MDAIDTQIEALFGVIADLTEGVRSLQKAAAKVAGTAQFEADKVKFEKATKAVSSVVTPLVARYRDMPSKQMWMSQRFDDIIQGRPVVLRGRDASFQLVRDFEALEASVQWAVIAEIKRSEEPYRFWRYCPDDNHTCNDRACLKYCDQRRHLPTTLTNAMPTTVYFRGQPITSPSGDPSDD